MKVHTYSSHGFRKQKQEAHESRVVLLGEGPVEFVSTRGDEIFGGQICVTFLETKIPGVFEIRIESKPDERGFFARTWCRNEFEKHGLNPKLVQCSISLKTSEGRGCSGTI